MQKCLEEDYGFTGGTVDKLESIPGYKIGIDIDEFKENVKKVGISLIGQTLNLAPADKKIYALRDAISCVDSIPLIASSIMSKKIASGANKLVLEVMVGSGAFMQTEQEAIELSKQMNLIAKLANKQTICVLTNMNEPLGRSVGNTLEIIEVIESLKGNISDDVKVVVCTLGAYMLKMAGKGDDIEKNKKIIESQILNGKGYNKFKELVAKQGGIIDYIEDTNLFERAKYEYQIISDKKGFVKKVDARTVGEVSVLLGAGRTNKEDNIEKEVGILLHKKVGDKVEAGEPLATVCINNMQKIEETKKRLFKAYEIVAEEVIRPKEILGIIK